MVLPIAPDDTDAIAAAADAATGCDLLITSGGASVGAHDLVQGALKSRGMTLDFWKIAMRPGKPLMHGNLRGVPVLGLPGNPVSSLITAILFVLPALRRLTGRAGDGLAPSRALLGADLPANDHRADHLRARLATDAEGRPVATAFSRQDSAMIRLLSAADALILRPPHAPASPSGAEVPIIRLDLLGL